MGLNPPQMQMSPLPVPPLDPENQEHYAFEAKELTARAKKAQGQQSTIKNTPFDVKEGELFSSVGQTTTQQTGLLGL